MSKSPLFYELLRRFGADIMISTLAPFITEKRKIRADSVIENRLKSVHTAVEKPSDVHNALATVRTAEALGLLHMHLIGYPQKRQGRQTMKGADRWIELSYYLELKEFIKNMQKQGLQIFGAAPRGEIPLNNVPVDRPFCILFGNEKKGLSEEAAKACDLLFQIPMHGFCESFNVSVSAGVTLYTLSEKRRAFLKGSSASQIGDLSKVEKEEELAWLYLKTVGLEQGKKLLLAKEKPVSKS